LLERLLRSLEVQTIGTSHYEVIIVHNYTNDGTEEMAQAWCARQPFPARYFRKNFRGPTRSRDFGARDARGQFVVFTDDDCVATPDWLRMGLAAFSAPAIRAKAKGSDYAKPVGLVQGQTQPMPGQAQRFPFKTVCVDRATVFFETCNIFYRKEAFLAVGGFSEDFLDEFYGEDTDLGWKVQLSGYLTGYCPEALVHHEIFHLSFYRWLAEPLFFKNIPYLVRKYPALRDSMYHRYFLTKDTCLFNLLLVALLAGLYFPLLGLILSLPYFVERYRNGSRIQGIPLRLIRVIVGIPRGAFMWYALVRGSLRARTTLL
jgi:GT2 family glycosyltransferase